VSIKLVHALPVVVEVLDDCDLPSTLFGLCGELADLAQQGSKPAPGRCNHPDLPGVSWV
jgi:hypothetical protein